MLVYINAIRTDLTFNDIPGFVRLLGDPDTNISAATETGFTGEVAFNSLMVTLVATSVNLSYVDSDGGLILAGGSDLSFDLYIDRTPSDFTLPDAQFAFEGLDVGALVTAIAQEYSGEVPLTVPTLLGAEILALNLSDDADVMDMTWDGAPFNPATGSRFELAAGNDVFYDGHNSNVIMGRQGSDIIYGRGGADLIDGGLGLNSLYGGGGDDAILGGPQFDLIYGQEGDDHIANRGGRDTIYGGDGDDSIRGSNSGEFIFGGAGNDSINGKLGIDLIYAGDGDDYINGSSGRDVLYGGDGADWIAGGNGRDFVSGGLGDDFVSAGRGSDTVMGGLGDDYIGGGSHRDRIYGGSGNNTLSGNGGFDLLYAGRGNNIMTGGIGADDFIFSDRSQTNLITDFEAGRGSEDIILRSVSAITSYEDLIENHIRQDGSDVVIENGEGLVIRLNNTLLTDLTEDNFLF
ncbi:MAG: calcium-binding protein [Yoonia sp.]|nr:calcium-binding protein [Yoonia sp.]